MTGRDAAVTISMRVHGTEREWGGSMRTDSDVEVSAWIKIGDSTEIDYDVFADGQIELLIGGRGGFELVTTEQGLQNLLVHLEEALRAARRLGDTP